jgi:RHS repeat-associated protein
MYVVGSTKYYVHQNHLFSVAAVTDAAGVTRERYSYTSYGDRAVRTTVGAPLVKSQLNNGIGFTGYVINGEINQYHARARQFNPVHGRFLSRDPLSINDIRGLMIAGVPFDEIGSILSESFILVTSPGPGTGYIDGWSQYNGYFTPNALDPSGLAWYLYCYRCGQGSAVKCILFNDEDDEPGTVFDGKNGIPPRLRPGQPPYGENGPLPPNVPIPIVPGPWGGSDVVPKEHSNSGTVPRIGNDWGTPGRHRGRTGLTIHPIGSGGSLGCLGVDGENKGLDNYNKIRDAMLESERKGEVMTLMMTETCCKSIQSIRKTREGGKVVIEVVVVPE